MTYLLIIVGTSRDTRRNPIRCVACHITMTCFVAKGGRASTLVRIQTTAVLPMLGIHVTALVGLAWTMRNGRAKIAAVERDTFRCWCCYCIIIGFVVVKIQQHGGKDIVPQPRQGCTSRHFSHRNNDDNPNNTNKAGGSNDERHFLLFLYDFLSFSL